MRDWWLRALLVLQRPRPVFVALRDDSKESLADRAEHGTRALQNEQRA